MNYIEMQNYIMDLAVATCQAAQDNGIHMRSTVGPGFIQLNFIFPSGVDGTAVVDGPEAMSTKKTAEEAASEFISYLCEYNY